MGLDGVELVMEVEDHFKVILPDAECAQVRTVADLGALVISRLPRSGRTCPTARRFFDLRAHAMEATGLSARAIRRWGERPDGCPHLGRDMRAGRL